MRSSLQLLFAFVLVNTIVVESRSIFTTENDEEIQSYRHQFEHSVDFQALRWSLKQLNKDDLCEFCDVAIPLVLFRFGRDEKH